MRLAATLAPALLLVLAGCSDQSPSADAGADASDIAVPDVESGPPSADTTEGRDTSAVDTAPSRPSPSDYCETMASAFCAFYLRCGRVVARDQASCEGYFLAACNETYERRYVALARAGLISLSPSGITACRAHLATVSCDDQLRDLDGPCAGLWEGASPTGSPCGLDIESFVCAPGSSCVLGLDLCGTCRAVAADGEACGNGSAVCLQGSECRDGRCSPRARVGEVCSARTCVLGARCTGGTCVAPATVGEGEACDSNRRCVYGASCVGGRCVAGGRVGDPCSSAMPCAVGRCADGRCSPLLVSGESCTVSTDCADGYCTSRTCRTLPGACLR